jgi:peptide deformylase
MGLVTLYGSKAKGLRHETLPVDDIESQVIPYLDEAKNVLNREDGVGLAAPQIGVNYAWYIDKLETVYINPEIFEADEAVVSVFEGCLSVPGRWFNTKRSGRIAMRFTDISGEEQVLKFSGVSAWVAQHECDHLKGTLICDHGERVYKGE